MIGRSQWLSRSESIPWQSVQQVLYKFLQILIPPMEISSHALYIEMCNNIIYHWLELHLNCCQAQFQYVFAAANDLRQHYYLPTPHQMPPTEAIISSVTTGLKPLTNKVLKEPQFSLHRACHHSALACFITCWRVGGVVMQWCGTVKYLQFTTC